ncbi:MAG: IS110 family transposase [Firmicutes bacterium]|nr:IS110 family transposase [Bacillota bacterium]
MNAVGIDVSKGKSMVAVLRPLGVVVAKPFEVNHTASELGELARFLKSLDGETKVVMEHTGRYYEPVAQVIHAQGLLVSAVNPLLIREYGGNSLRRVKTDKADSKKMARYGLDNWAELREYTPMDTIRYELKTLNRQFHLASKNRTACSNNLIALLDQSFPGVRDWFDSPVREDGSQKWVDFARAFWHVDCVRSRSHTAFVERYQRWCKSHRYNFRLEKAEEIYRQSSEMIALVPKSNTTKLLVQEAASQLLNLSRMVEVLRAEMNRLAAQLPEYSIVMSMYGVGKSFGPQLMAEIGDIRRFAGKQSLVAFAGVDPMVNQSGMKASRSNKSSKRGSPLLRKTLFNVMSCLLQNAPPDEPVFQFLDRKRAEGKPYYVYMTAGANKFLRIYFGKVRDHLAALDMPPPDDASALPQ